MSILNFWKNHGLLGINARNLLYHLPLNTKQAIRMADDKLKTKSFLSARDITVPRLLGKVSSYEDIEKFNYDGLPNRFVVKPNNGYGGEGIIPLEKDPETKGFRKLSGKPFSPEELKEHLSDIIDGRFSLGGFSDIAFFEQKLELHHSLQKLVPAGGLPDVRIIFYNQIPIMAMLRLPTRASDGKANTHIGGVGVGIDLASGKTTYATQYNKFIQEIPEVGPAAGHAIPGFYDMLLMGSKIQSSIELGYLAVDFVPDENTGPTLLEINARAGLMVQVANRAPLRKRLNQIKGTRVGSPEKGVQIGQDLFGEKTARTPRDTKTETRPVIGLTEEVELLLPHGSMKILARLSPNSEETYLDKKILDQIRLSEDMKKDEPLKFILGGQRHRTIPTPKRFQGKYRMIIGAKHMHSILIDPRKPEPEPETKTTSEKEKADTAPTLTTREKLLSYDHHLADIEERISLLYYLRPTNLEEEKKKFFKQADYNPQFKYRKLKFDTHALLNELSMLYIEPNLEHSRLFLDKKKELKHKLELLLARGTADFTPASRKLYAEPDKDTLKEAETAMELFTEDDSTAKTITATQLVDHFNSMFKDLGVEGWQARTADILADCTAQQRKQKILVRQDATFTEEHKQKLTLHEFYTHVLTTINGNLQPYRLLKLGTPLFLRTQEGLAVYNQSHFATPPRESQNSKSALLYYTICQAQNKSFRATYDALKKLNYSDELCWQLTLKAKRGLADTSQAGGFTKDLLYFSGYLRIRDFVKNGGDLHRLYIGKVDLDTLDQIEQLPGIKPPRFTPPFLDPDSIR